MAAGNVSGKVAQSLKQFSEPWIGKSREGQVSDVLFAHNVPEKNTSDNWIR